MSKKVKGIELGEKSQKSYILVYQRDDGQKQLLCSYDIKEDVEEIISQIKSKKLELPLEGLDNHEKLSMLEIPHNVTFGLSLPSVKLRKEELDKLMSDLEDAVSEMESDTPKI